MISYRGSAILRCGGGCGTTCTVELPGWVSAASLDSAARRQAEVAWQWKDGRCAQCAETDPLPRSPIADLPPMPAGS